MTKKRIYVSGALTSSGVPLENLEQAKGVAQEIMDLGASPFVPHFSILYDEAYVRRPHDFWLSLDFPWLECADAIYRIPGKSKGADAEVAFAECRGIPVFHDMDSLRQWLAAWELCPPPAPSSLTTSEMDFFAEKLKKNFERGYFPKVIINDSEKLHREPTGAVRSVDADSYRLDLVSPIAAHLILADVRSGLLDSDTYRIGLINCLQCVYKFLAGEGLDYLFVAVQQLSGILDGGWCPGLANVFLSVGHACHEGAVKYDDFNWEHGFPVHDLLNHAIRHLLLDLQGDTTEDHLGHASWNLFAAIHSHELWPHLNAGHLRGPGCKPPAQSELISKDKESESATCCSAEA